ncbi:FAD-dependent monooxygenase [Hoeflea sp.]|uniref:FAD-dependent monooxygenase n=1 Tax=Hoeflea sp. TaxID=1940281 RepID=UPI003B02AB22
MTTDTVLVVGGRTTGLMMASELARRGVPTRCIDKSPGIDPHVRANLLHSRTLEIFQGLGLDEHATRGSVPEEGLVFYRNGELIGESPHMPIDSPFPFGLSQSQAHTEATLEAHLNGFGVEVERSVSLTGIAQDADGVTVTLQHEETGEEQARCQWLVACDGAHSAVRHLIGSAFPGEADELPYILGDVLVAGDDHLEPNKGHVFFHDRGELYMFTRLPGNRHFIVASLDAATSTEGTPSLEEFQSIVAERGQSSLRLSDPQWLGYFRINYRLVPHYRRGRVFLAGDAAHVHSLLAGQGMNTGIQDAHNLGWKLAQVARGRAGADILESYEAERRKVAENVVETTRQITNTMELYASLTQDERDKLIANLFTPEPARLDAARSLQEVDLDYGASPLTLSQKDSIEGGPAPGTRAPDAKDLVADGRPTTLFKLPADDQYRLFFFCGERGDAPAAEISDAADASSRFASWLKPYIVTKGETGNVFGKHAVLSDEQGNMHRAYAAKGPCIYLIRPDGYVAYRSSELASVDRYFEHLGVAAG